MILYYVRHGDPIYDPDSLTPLGHRQAEAVAKRLAVHGIDRIFASTSTRAQLTAKPTAEILRKEVELLDFCHENHAWKEFAYPDEDGRERWIFHQVKGIQKLVSREVRDLGYAWYKHPDFTGHPFQAGVERIDREVDAWLESLGFKHDRENGCYTVLKPNHDRIALFAHQGFGVCFLSSVLDIPLPLVCTHFDHSHTGLTVIDFKQVGDVVIPKALMVGSDGHIYREGLPTMYDREQLI